MPYTPFPDQPLLEISSIYTFYHFHFASGYVFRGERHPFWEMVYVQNGQVDIGADDELHMLSNGDVIFHRPNEFHSIWANYAHSPDLIVISFQCDSPAAAFFEKRRLHATERQQQMFSELLREASQAFLPPLDHGNRVLNPACPGGTYSLRLTLTRLMMELLRSGGDALPAETEPVRIDAESMKAIEAIVECMHRRLPDVLSFRDLCRRVGMSETSVKQLFRRHFDTTPMAYYEQLRMSEARRRLRQPGSSVTSVACEMGFSSPAYFATRFRHVTGMTPRDFLRESSAF